MNPFVTRNDNEWARCNAYIKETGEVDVGANIFQRGLGLPGDNKMSKEEEDVVIEVIHRCFK